jgi:uncharacterized protein YqjF (DUF2071 family)
MFVASWNRLLFIHYRVPEKVLQDEVPFPLLTHSGSAWVSLVAFSQEGFRWSRGGHALDWTLGGVCSHPFLNVRTYVDVGGEPGVYFLKEWVTSSLSTLIARSIYGLPFTCSWIDYDHQSQAGLLTGHVLSADEPGQFVYEGRLDACPDYAMQEAGSLGAFLVEHYTAYTRQSIGAMRFRVWHEPWRLTDVNITVLDDSLLSLSGDWFHSAELSHAQYTPGLRHVLMGAPALLRS